MTVHDPKNPRHARIFELLRHGDPSLAPHAPAKVPAGDVISVADQDALKQFALKSFAKSEVVGVDGPLKPGRNHKLF